MSKVVYPENGLERPLKNIDPFVWDRGYYAEQEEGVWYEVYVKDHIKQQIPLINLDDPGWSQLSNFKLLLLDHYFEDQQITFFVPKGEGEATLAGLTLLFLLQVRVDR